MTQSQIASRLNKKNGQQASKEGRKYCLQALKKKKALDGDLSGKSIHTLNNKELGRIVVREFGINTEIFYQNRDIDKGKRRAGSHFILWCKYMIKNSVGGESLVYCIGNKDYVKVGYTTDLSKRHKQIQTSCPFKVDVLNTFRDGDLTFERYLHKELKQYNTYGEWFTRNDEVDKQLLIGKYKPKSESRSTGERKIVEIPPIDHMSQYRMSMPRTGKRKKRRTPKR